LAEKLREIPADEVVSPAMGGLFVGHEVARTLGLPHIFVEKEEGKLVLRRGFKIEPGRRYIVTEDVVTRGGRMIEAIDIIRGGGGNVVAAASLVDRSGGKAPDFGCPFISLVQLNVETFEADKLPPDLAGTPAIKPGSK
jgi:orotate phosphoribosyltransferase